jgi:hypothetical protein
MRRFRNATGHDPRGSFVWAYTERFGAPRPLTVDAVRALRRFNRVCDASFNEPETVVQLGRDRNDPR